MNFIIPSRIYENFHRFPDLFHLGNPANPGCIASQGTWTWHDMAGRPMETMSRACPTQQLLHVCRLVTLFATKADLQEANGGNTKQLISLQYWKILEDFMTFQHFSISVSTCAKALRCLIGLSHFATKYHITKATFVPDLQPDCRGSTTCKHLWDANACNCHYCHSTLTH